jgi:tungstate transport system ATP-binding protein
MSAIVRMRDLVVRRGGRTTLEIGSLEVERGEVLALVGPNGAGKSTLLLAVARLIKIQRGEIFFADRPLAEWDALEYRRKVAFVFQAPLLLDMNVFENVRLGLAFRGTGKAETHERVNHWLKQLGIESLSRRPAGELSGGESQRVSLARALVLDPELILLDEPFQSLDPPTHTKLLEELLALLAENHPTTIIVTHKLKEAESLSDRVAVIVEGRLRQIGRAGQIKARPADHDVATFLQAASN